MSFSHEQGYEYLNKIGRSLEIKIEGAELSKIYSVLVEQNIKFEKAWDKRKNDPGLRLAIIKHLEVSMSFFEMYDEFLKKWEKDFKRGIDVEKAIKKSQEKMKSLTVLKVIINEKGTYE